MVINLIKQNSQHDQTWSKSEKKRFQHVPAIKRQVYEKHPAHLAVIEKDIKPLISPGSRAAIQPLDGQMMRTKKFWGKANRKNTSKANGKWKAWLIFSSSFFFHWTMTSNDLHMFDILWLSRDLIWCFPPRNMTPLHTTLHQGLLAEWPW